ncbi:unnamed protein product [Coregonus sp. 'balchen']|nr:unnamed protein product [Coregonus sp. 'balchen']
MSHVRQCPTYLKLHQPTLLDSWMCLVISEGEHLNLQPLSSLSCSVHVICLRRNGISAIFNFQSLLTVILLLVCTCAYLRAMAPSLLDKNKTGLLGIFWKCARIGERKSPYVAVSCVIMALSILFSD